MFASLEEYERPGACKRVWKGAPIGANLPPPSGIFSSNSKHATELAGCLYLAFTKGLNQYPTNNKAQG